ncbi:MAG: TM2 domain-containing protein [Chitinivibrionia bacterium]|nr:TM2 domain-containing protein [Chitinivibrionia bacterium]
MADEVYTKAPDEKFCSSCGKIIKEAAEICPQCGVRQKKQPSTLSNTNDGRWTTLLILSFFLGFFGADHFYVGKIKTGIIKLLVTIFTFGILGTIWWIIDIVCILTEKFTDSDGNRITKND